MAFLGAQNCLLARRLIERGSRFVQLYHTHWDSHGEMLKSDFEKFCKDVDQASAALVLDLKEHGMLDDALVIGGGESGRTPMGENCKTAGRDHSVESFSMWMACARLKQGHRHGQSDTGGFKTLPPKVHSRQFDPLGQIVHDSGRFPHMIHLVKREKCSARQVYQPPGGESIGARASAMRSAFVRSLIPNVPPSELELADAFSLLKLDADDLRCVYCGDRSTEWDHFYPVMRNGQPTGYLTRIQNLVPACGKCNQSKGNRYWKNWMTSTAPLSPSTRGVPKLSQRIKRLQTFEAWGAEATVDFESALGSEAMKQHNDSLKQILSLMTEAETHSKALRSALLDELPHVIQEKKPSLWKRLWRLVFGDR